MKRSFLFHFVIAICTCILFAGCFDASKMTFGNGAKWIPADFEPSKTILLVEQFEYGGVKTLKKMESYMAEKYPYKYEIVPLDIIKNREGKYANTKLYRYALVTTSHKSEKPGQPTVTGFDYNFYDRDLNKNYPATNKPSGFAIMTFEPVINTIVKKFQ